MSRKRDVAKSHALKSLGTSGKDKILDLGSRILDRYEIFEIRKGGMGIVYLTEDIVTKEKYAIKTFPDSSFYLSQDANQKFLSEIETLLSIPSTIHIVKPYAVEFIDSQPFLFMEYIPFSLRDFIGKANESHISVIAYQICLAMEAASSGTRSLVHADLKPDNVLINDDAIVKVTDFGTAQLVDSWSGKFAKQKSGTALYMSPEQLRGEVLDEQSDIFSFGMMMYEVLTGELPYPFDAKTLSSTRLRDKLEEFYNSIRFYVDDYDLSPWREINDITSSENTEALKELRRIILCCIFPYRHNRWNSFSEIRRIFDEYGRINFHSVITPQEIAADLYRKASLLHKIGNVKEAIRIYNQAIIKNPNDVRIWQDAANALAQIGDLSTAQGLIAQANELNPEAEFKISRLAS